MIRLAAKSCFTMANCLALLLSTACERSLSRRMPDIPPEFDHTTIGYQRLSGRVLARGDYIGVPHDVRVVGDYIVISDYPEGGSALHLIRAEDGRRILSFGRLGEGPGEFEGIPDVVAAPGVEGAFWAYDGNQARITLFRITDLLAGRTQGSRHVRLQVPRILYDLVMLDEQRAIGLGLFPGGRLALIDVDSAAIRYAGPLPPGPDGVPASVPQSAYRAFLAARPGGDQVVLATWRASQLEVYDREGNLLRKFDGPFPFEPDYFVDEGPRRPIARAGRLNRYGYVSVEATDRFIVALFSGRAEAFYRGDSQLAEYVHVFDWDGRFIQAYRLDRPATEIALREGGGQLVTVTPDPEPMVLIYPLPALLAKDDDSGSFR